MQLNNTYFSWRKVFTLSAGFLLALSVSTSCKKHENTIGSGSLSPESLLASGASDTFSLRTYSIADSSLMTKNPYYAVLGAYNDPKMGQFNASFYTQFTYGNLPDLDGATSIVVDSAVLGLEYRGYYGTLDPMTFEIYRLDEALSSADDSLYYADSRLDTINGNIIDPSNATQTPDPNGYTVVANDTLPNTQLRLHLNEEFREQFMEDIRAGHSGFSSITEFQTNYLKGLYVKVSNPNPPSGTGSALYFSLNDSKLTFYFHLDSSSNPQYTFDLTPKGCVDFNHVDIDNSTIVDEVISDTVKGNEQFYAQAFRSRAVVEFEGVNDIPKNSVIHNALIVLPVAYQTFSPYYPSANLSVSVRATKTDKTLYVLKGVAAKYDASLKRYVIDIRNYVQAIVSGETENTGLFLAPAYHVASADRVIFNGSSSTNKDKPKLIIKYTEY